MIDRDGWWVISGEDLYDMLQRVANGQDPDAVFQREYDNCENSDVIGDNRRCGVRVGPELLQCVKTENLRKFTAEGHLFFVCPDHVSHFLELGMQEVT